MMNISVFGLGYVGTVSAGCLAMQGNTVIGVDLNQTKVDMINRGIAPIIEKDIGDIISDTVEKGLLRATVDPHDAIRHSDMSFICVGTPSLSNGDLDLSHVRAVSEQIGTALRGKRSSHVVVGRSTMLPGSMRDVVLSALEECSGKKAGVDLGICYNPEFLREGTAVYDYHHPPKTVIGEHDRRAGDVLVALYEHINAPLIRTNIETAEIVKYTDNTWHALKVAFANEIGNLCKAVGIDGYHVMELFCQDTKLNLSPYYMKPGFAFGGSCLPKDVRALTYKAKSLDLELPVLNAILPSNRRQVEKGIRMIIGKGQKRIGILGFSFKAGTDDLRESPMIDVIESLVGKGYELKLYDRNVKLASLMGANQDYIMNRISHISRLMAESIDEVLDFAQTIVIGNNAPEFRHVSSRLKPGQVVVDLVHMLPKRGEAYDGICW
jgi:GDP-mannose 6-dehydrogenase